ncbi:hypothetical protein HPB50_011751 [Hyalomma asiaticum]|uniref:Uncharacterized protein n=1 Tax=Hyalomma asiaticum TaxID=266040 RepID=A0ACB7S221_HYAAI|nr:hypothetical protein HPB50_011751 [Hyalomma asiaticum]
MDQWIAVLLRRWRNGILPSMWKAESIQKLESSGAALTQSVELILDVQERFATVPNGPVADRVTSKLKAVLDKNPGFYALKQVSNSSSPENVFLYEAFTETGYGTAISAYLGPERTHAISVLPSRDQNIIIMHTPDIEAADRLNGDFIVNTEKRQVLLQGYLRQDGGNTCQGVIVVRNTGPTETIPHRVCWRAGTTVEIRKFGTSKKARITFAGKQKPRYMNYDNMAVPVRNYYKTIPACGQYGAVGHRADACPNLQPNTCGLVCGLHAPLVEGVRAPHDCVPRCSVCSGAHATNSRDCAAKFRTPKTAAQKGGKKKMAPKKSRHPGLTSDQPRREPSKTDKPEPPPGGGDRLSTASPPQGGPEK